MQQSKAAEIPEELFEHILQLVHDDYSSADDQEKKRHLSLLGRICRYWARLCRPNLFRSITLRNPDDVKHFREILDAPAVLGLQPVASMVVAVKAKVAHKDPPWIHLAMFLLDHKLRSDSGMEVELLPSAKNTWRTLHPSLPRAVPGPRNPITTLLLDGLHFSSARVLSHLLSALPTLHALQAYTLTFDVEPRLEDFSTIPYYHNLSRVRSDDLQLSLLLLPTLTSGRYGSATGRSRRNPGGIIIEDDLKILWDLLRIFDAISSISINRTYHSKSPCKLKIELHLSYALYGVR